MSFLIGMSLVDFEGMGRGSRSCIFLTDTPFLIRNEIRITDKLKRGVIVLTPDTSYFSKNCSVLIGTVI